MEQAQIVVIGAGQSGISTALSLKDLGLSALVLDEADEVASSWRKRYDRLRLNTCRPNSSFPKRPFAKGTPIIPTRENVVENIERHAAAGDLDLQFGTTVERIDADSDGWALETSDGTLRTRQVAVATGHEREPFIPDWPGRQAFRGELVHAAAYKNPERWVGKSVLVVGPGCSGMEIAYDLSAGAAGKVWLAVRTPPNIILRMGPSGIPGDMIAVALMRTPPKFADALSRVARKATIGDLTEFGLPVPEEGVFTRQARTGVAPAIVDPEVIDGIRSGAVEIVAGVESLDETGVLLSDGSRLEPDAVICATGYRRGLEPLVGHLGVLNDRGLPKAHAEDPAAPGLRFIGFVPRPGGLGYWAKQGERAAKAIAAELAAA